MSLAAVPAYFLVRWLGGERWLALGLATFTVALPDLLYSGFVLGESIAYPLALAAALFAVRALDRPTPTRQLVFIFAAGAATFTRIQFAALFVAFFAAALLGERLRVRSFVRRFATSLLIVGGPSVAFFVLKGKDGLGYYSGVFDLGLHPFGFLRWLAVDAMLLAFASFLALTPGAVVGLLAAITRPKSPRQRPFGLFVGVLAVVLFFEAALYATNGSDRFQERYLFALIPLITVAFTLFVQRARECRIAVLVLTAVLFVISVRIPLGSYAVAGHAQDSPFLRAVTYLTDLHGQGTGSLIVALLAAILLALAALSALRPRAGAPIALAATIAIASVASIAATNRITLLTQRAAYTYYGSDPRVVDKSTSGTVGLLSTPSTSRQLALELMFWNRSLTDVLVPPGAPRIDAFRFTPARIAGDGRLLVGGAPYRRPLVVMRYGSQVEVTGARTLARYVNWTLWQPSKDFRFSSFTYGLYFDGWLSAIGSTTVWPNRSGRVDGVVRYELRLPSTAPRNEPIEFRTRALRRRVVLRPGLATTVDIPVRSVGRPVKVSFRVIPPLLIVLQNRALSAYATVTVIRGTRHS
jgi:hypothetical protein